MSPAPSRPRIRPWLVVGDLALAGAWVCAGALVKLLVYGGLGLAGRPEAEAVKVSLSIVYMFLFAWLEAASGGASYNPLTVLAAALASHGGSAVYLFTAFARIPAQVMFLYYTAIAICVVLLFAGFGPRSIDRVHLSMKLITLTPSGNLVECG